MIQTYRVSHLFDQTIILASMLQMYPFSKDKSDFREEIAMLTSVHHEQLIAWKNDGKMQKKQRMKRGSVAKPTQALIQLQQTN